MKRFSYLLFGLALCLPLASMAGCESGEPMMVETPEQTPEEAAAAMEAYEKTMSTDS